MDEEDEDSPVRERKKYEGPMDLMCGIGPFEVRILCESQFEGGGGYTPAEVGNMTPDMAYLRLIDRKRLKGGGSRQTMPTGDVAELSNGNAIRGRTESGEVFYAYAGTGTSVAEKLWDEEKKKQEQQQRRERHRRIRKGQ